MIAHVETRYADAMSPTPSAADFGRYWFDTRKVVALTEAAIERRLRSEVGIGQTLYLVLSAVDVNDGVFNQKAVADVLGTTPATVSRQLDAAERAGYLTVRTSPSTRRENVISLTPSGREVVARGDEVAIAEARRVAGVVGDREFLAAAAAVSEMLKALQPGASPEPAHRRRSAPRGSSR